MTNAILCQGLESTVKQSLIPYGVILNFGSGATGFASTHSCLGALFYTRRNSRFPRYLRSHIAIAEVPHQSRCLITILYNIKLIASVPSVCFVRDASPRSVSSVTFVLNVRTRARVSIASAVRTRTRVSCVCSYKRVLSIHHE